MSKNYYQILGLARDATPEQIKKAYRKLARKYHPDVSKEVDAEAQMQSLNVAYDTLMDAEKKQDYDFSLDHPQGAGFSGQSGAGFAGQYTSATGSDFSGFEDLFGRFGAGFGGGSANRFNQQGARPLRGEDQHARIDVDIQVAYQGDTQQFSLQIPSYTALGEVEIQRKTLQVKIPKGIPNGQQIRLAHQGQQGLNGGTAGDLYIEIHYRETDQIRVEGADVYLKVNVTPWELALGQKIAVNTPAGKVQVSVPKGGQSGQQLRLKDKGIPAKTPGHLFLNLNMVIPPADSAAQQQAYQDLAQQFSDFQPREK